METKSDEIYLFVPVCAEGDDVELWEAARRILAANGILNEWHNEVPADGFFLTTANAAYRAASALRAAGFEASYLSRDEGKPAPEARPLPGAPRAGEIISG
jgi:hypothetical protein